MKRERLEALKALLNSKNGAKKYLRSRLPKIQAEAKLGKETGILTPTHEKCVKHNGEKTGKIVFLFLQEIPIT